ncbi:MAG: hypothetical protein H6621_02130 [Halobacteriovoraceae bacterium]|nr:hypothetical protein [Halobacteriovoraceae bacterium]MCB9093841.1 hypothetical protein [Halobacteriovoraceae bacterium]
MLKNFLLVSLFSGMLLSCSGFKAERVDGDESDEKALEITDNWVMRDTENAIDKIIQQMQNHKGYQRYLAKKSGRPAVFIAEVQNLTSESYFPISDLNDELLNRLSNMGDFVLVDEAARKRILEEIKYQNDGMVDPNTAKSIGKQTGADLLIFGNVHMRPETRKGKTIKQYSVNIRMTDIESGTEILRTRTKVHKYSEKNKFGW